MKQWGIFASSSPNSAGSDWRLYPKVAELHEVFAWAAPGTSYAAHVTNDKNKDLFAIGVAVSDSPTGPYIDAHPSGPIISDNDNSHPGAIELNDEEQIPGLPHPWTLREVAISAAVLRPTPCPRITGVPTRQKNRKRPACLPTSGMNQRNATGHRWIFLRRQKRGG
ncbi:hypothetical protein KXV68_009743 [Aspergillus fumigatus]|nr:hypothetical protein KXV48_005250 [Aspergillus fumigatus]KAH2110509.1 hypothetical protein KXV46_005819 [Aspergillus fumigatus]KAH2149116.1 hypothetical protein KXV68_009743 [Aspergillus fumigatus]KAH2229112.1 hypothetical protein KXV37_004319 [Aspergillus fumigatus]KAH2379352.1 hypothetical protein KXV62_009189 [Aspergillus fumigatus]